MVDAGVTGRAAAVAGTAAAQALAAAFRCVAVLRRAKPLHPKGILLPGRLERHGLSPGTGVSWLDERGDDHVLVRLSRSAGLPEGWPDVWGLGLRVPIGGPASQGAPVEPADPAAGIADLLLSTSFAPPGGRHLLALRRRPLGPFGSLLPYRAPGGDAVLVAALRPDARRPGAAPAGTAARAGTIHPAGTPRSTHREALAAELAREPLRLTLAVATGTSPWRPFGTLTVGGSAPLGSGDGVPDAGEGDAAAGGISFDPVLHPVPGLRMPAAIALVRARSYAGARAGRRAAPADLERRPGRSGR